MTNIIKSSCIKLDLLKMNEYLDSVKKLTGTKIKMSNPITRCIYEQKSLLAGRWLSIKEFEDTLNTK